MRKAGRVEWVGRGGNQEWTVSLYNSETWQILEGKAILSTDTKYLLFNLSKCILQLLVFLLLQWIVPNNNVMNHIYSN